jgi:hypothetical protein
MEALAFISKKANGLLSMLTAMQFASEKDRTKMRARLRERLTDFANDVMACADKSGT